jgi:DNA repair protein RadC
MTYSATQSIKFWAEEDRPREKMLNKGKNALSNAELIAILLGSGSRNESAVSLAQRILASIGNDLNELGKIDLKFLTVFKGMGEAKSLNLLAALELGRRRKDSIVAAKPVINSSQSAFEYLFPVMADLPTEEFWIILLSQSNKVINMIQISTGGIAGTIADPRIILREALQYRAVGLILCHNHPSGNLKPSEMDIRLTIKIKSACELLDVRLQDHLIVGDKSYYSFADEGQL